MAFDQLPITNFHELNADWLLRTVKSAADRVEAALSVIDGVQAQITALQNADAQLRQQIGDLQTSLRTMGDVLSEQHSEIVALQNADSNINESLAALSEQITSTVGQVEDLELNVYNGLWPALATQYAAGDTYNTGDIVYASAEAGQAPKLWRALQDNITGTFDSTKWQAVTVADMIGLLRQTMADNITEEFSPSTLYQVNDYVMHEGVLYKRVGAAGRGAWNTDNWDPVSIMSEMVELRERVDDVLMPLVVNVTRNTGVYPSAGTADRSFSDIVAAATAGRPIIFRYFASSTTIWYLTNIVVETSGGNLAQIGAWAYIDSGSGYGDGFRVTMNADNTVTIIYWDNN